MNKSTRSTSLPAEPVLSVGLKGDGGTRGISLRRRGEENEIEENYGISSLCFKTDLMTVVQRKKLMERQKDISDININREIECFSSMINQLTCLWQDSEVTEVLHRLSNQADGLELKTKKLAADSASLGSLRQDLSTSNTTSVMVQYVDLLSERNADVHEHLVNARKVLVDNNISIEKPEEAVLTVTGKTRSVSLVSQPSNTIANTKREKREGSERSKSVCEGIAKVEILENDNGVRKKSRKCSLFATISESENVHNDNQESVVDTDEYKYQAVIMKRKKSSKKVSIAENLNCDYSDTNNSDVEDENPIALDEIIERDNYAQPEQKVKTTSKVALEIISRLLLSIFFLFLSFILYTLKHPVISTVIIVFILGLYSFYYIY